jgi:hypothetical protein
MILTMVDEGHGLRVYEHNGKGLREIGALRTESVDPLELAQHAIAIAAMAGVSLNGSTPPAKAVKVATGRKAMSREEKLARDRERKRARREPKALPPAKAKSAASEKSRAFAPDYAPDLSTITGKVLLFLEAHPGSFTHDIGEDVNRPVGHVSATLSGMKNRGLVEATPSDTVREGGGAPLLAYSLTAYGHECLARSRE